MLITTLIALSLGAAPPKPFTPGPSIEGVSEYRLPNGLRVLLVPDASKPSTTVNLTVFVGSRHENYGEKGMAHLFEHMLFKRTKKFASIKDELTKLGGWANGTTWYDRTNYFESFPSDDKKLDTAIELEAERLRNAIVSRDELVTEMTVVRNEFEMGESDPEGVLDERVMSAAFTWHNYGDSTIGAKSDIEKVPNERLLAFYETYYQPDNAMLVVAGKFDEQRALKRIADLFGQIPRPKRTLPQTYTEEPTQDGEVSVTVRRTGGAPRFEVGYHTPSAGDVDAAAMDVLSSVLGDAPAGRLYRALVETKKAAEVHCSSFSLKEHGFTSCKLALQPKDPVAAARDGLLATIEGFAKKPATKEEVERAKASLLKDFDLQLNASDRVGILLSEYAAAGDWRLLFLARDRVAAVTPEDVTRVAARYFKPSNRTFGEYVPTPAPERSELPALVDLGAKGKGELAKGEAFDASPKNIDMRTARSTLGNGAKVGLLSKKTRAETVHVAIALHYGDEKTLANQTAAADLTARMLLRGTKKKSRQQVKELLDQWKADVSVHTDRQGMQVSIEAHRPELERVLDLVGECLTEPAFEAKELDTLKREVVADAEEKKDDPMAVGMRAVQRILRPVAKGHPLYVRSYSEIIAETQAVKVEQLRGFHGRFYGAQAAQLAVVGDFDAAAVSAQLGRLFGAWKSKEAYARINLPFAPLDPKPSVIETPDKAVAFFGAGTKFKLRDTDPDYPAMLMADTMLGGGFLNGRLPQRLREKDGLSYGAGTRTSISSYDEPAAMVGFAIYAPQNVTKVQTGFSEEMLRAVQSGFTDAELKLAREGLLKEREQMRAQDPYLAMQLLESLELDRQMAFEQQVEDKLRALSAAEVGAVLKRYIDPKAFSILTVGDFKKKNAQ